MYIHHPVLVTEVLEYLKCSESKVYIDGTLGEGGHAERILEESFPTGRVVGIDLDEDILQKAENRLKRFGSRVTFVRDNFKNIKTILPRVGLRQIDGFLIDLGVSSLHFESRERGFSFQLDAPLDMRLDQRNPMTAAQIVNQSGEAELADMLWRYGEERWSRRIARTICSRRRKAPISTTGQLAEIVASAIPAKYRPRKIHPATRTFQALRIMVNQELQGLEQAVIDGIDVLRAGSRICIISYHSLEDRIVKWTFRKLAKAEEANGICPGGPKIRILTPKPIIPSEAEIQGNPRARSAKLRVAEKC
ncbi:MAG: 16S rRNA (cytosine(1402)-N(4))-methyltransferase RsmH [bacterium]